MGAQGGEEAAPLAALAGGVVCTASEAAEPAEPAMPPDVPDAPVEPEPVPVPVAPVVPVPPAVPALLPAGGATAPEGVPGAPVVLAAPPSASFFWQADKPSPAARRMAKAGFHVLVVFIQVS